MSLAVLAISSALPTLFLFNIEIISTGDNSIEKHWTLRLIDINEDELCPPPNTQFDVSMRISSVMVSDWINNCKLINGDFAIGVEKDKFIMVRCDSDEGTLNLKQSLPSVMANVFQTSEDFTNHFDLERTPDIPVWDIKSDFGFLNSSIWTSKSSNCCPTVH